TVRRPPCACSCCSPRTSSRSPTSCRSPRSTRSRIAASSVHARRSAGSGKGGVFTNSGSARVCEHTPRRLAALAALAALVAAGCGGGDATRGEPAAVGAAVARLREPVSGALVVVSKQASGRARIYTVAKPTAGAVTTLRRRGSIDLGDGEQVTAGDVSADGRTIVLRTYSSAYVWQRRPGE